MTAPFTYRTITREGTGEFKAKGSKFLGFVRPVDNDGDMESFLDDIRSLHPKARHHCYGWRCIRDGQVIEKAYDAGEPSATAGKPILGQLKRAGLYQSMIIVVRYFGGTKLGTSGLIQAYRAAARTSIENAVTRKVERMAWYRLHLDHGLQPDLYKCTKALEIEVQEPAYTEKMTCLLAIPLSDHRVRLLHLLQMMSGLDFDRIEDYVHQMDINLSLEWTD